MMTPLYSYLGGVYLRGGLCEMVWSRMKCLWINFKSVPTASLNHMSLKWWRQPQLHLPKHSGPPHAFPFILLPLYRAISFREKHWLSPLNKPRLFIDREVPQQITTVQSRKKRMITGHLNPKWRTTRLEQTDLVPKPPCSQDLLMLQSRQWDYIKCSTMGFLKYDDSRRVY